MDIPTVTADQMREVDRLLIEEYHFDILQLMENAGRHLGEFVLEQLSPNIEQANVIMLVGKGNNGGGALSAARFLLNRQVHTRVVLSHKENELSAACKKQLEILRNMKARIDTFDPHSYPLECDILIDGLIGYGLSGSPRRNTRALIEIANASKCPIVSLDIPSGLDATTGDIRDPCIRAHTTLTLALPKAGLYAPLAKDVVGDLYLADIGAPSSVYERIGLRVEDLFAESPIIKLSHQ